MLNDLFIKNLTQVLNCSLDDLSIWFPRDKTEIFFIENDRTELISKGNFSFIRLNITMGEHEKEKFYDVIRKFHYPLADNFDGICSLLHNKETSNAVILSTGRIEYEMLDNNFSQFFDSVSCVLTNDEKLIISLQNQIFEMSPPWLVFDDYVFAYRNHYWRADWKNFWNRLSEEEKQTYFIKFDAPKDWIGWLSAEEFELS